MSIAANFSPSVCPHVTLGGAAAVALHCDRKFDCRSAAALAAFTAARGNKRPALTGLELDGVIFAWGVLAIFARSLGLFVTRTIHALAQNQAHFSQGSAVVPRTNNARIYLPAALEYLAGRPLSGWIGGVVALVMLGLTGWILGPVEAHTYLSAASALVIVTMYVGVYHNASNALLRMVPAALCGAAAHSMWRTISLATCWLIVVLSLGLLINIIWTGDSRSALPHSEFSLAGVAAGVIDEFPSLPRAANALALGNIGGILLTCVLGTKDRSSP
jgi:hypothetical protein